MADCAHDKFQAEVKIARLEDIGQFVAEIRIFCTTCGEAFRFLGAPAGLTFTGPTVSIDGLELHVPIEPEGEKRLQTTARYEMPEKLKRH